MKSFEEIMASTDMSEAELESVLLQHIISKVFESSFSTIFGSLSREATSFLNTTVAPSPQVNKDTPKDVSEDTPSEQLLDDRELSNLSKAFDLHF